MPRSSGSWLKAGTALGSGCATVWPQLPDLGTWQSVGAAFFSWKKPSDLQAARKQRSWSCIQLNSEINQEQQGPKNTHTHL